MAHERILGSLQYAVMRAVKAWDGAPTGVEVARRLDVGESGMTLTMRRLEARGFVRSWWADPLPVRGGRRRRVYAVTAEGEAAIRRAAAHYSREVA